jgi:hypothetical protein
VLQASAYALLIARKRYPRRWRAENAVRHFTWQAWLAATYGRDVADVVGRAHERLSSDARDTAVDQRNNAAGQAWGHAHEHELAGQSLRRVLDAASEAAMSKWDAGELAH